MIETVVVDGMALATQLRAEIAAEVASLVAGGQRPPCLAVVLVGDNPASLSYIKGKRRACERAGMTSREHDLPATASERDILAVVRALKADDGVDGILVQLPLPKPLRASVVTEAIDPAKDVDGLHTQNAGRLLAGLPGLRPCTPLGILEVLDRHGVALEGANVVVVGRSALVGKPVALLLLERNATVTMCHSRTRDLAEVVRAADVVVAAAGSPRLVKGDWIRPGAAVVDLGVNMLDGQQVGDVDFEGALGRARLITPSRGGVGPLTITMLLRNTLEAMRMRQAADARIDVPAGPDAPLDPGLLRADLDGFPELSEPEVLRHYLRLSQLNFSAATNFYPLGSCTMKYNPTANDEAAALPGFACIHPYAPAAHVQGALSLLRDLERWLAEVCGLDAVSLQPAAGAQGELTGIKMIRAHHLARGRARSRILIPTSAHGTNPASAALSGYQAVAVPCDDRGLLTLAAVERALDDEVAAIMVTNPNTLGLFEVEIERVAAAVHAAGALVGSSRDIRQ